MNNKKGNRVDINPIDLSNDHDEVTENILKDHDEKLTKAVGAVFDLFDKDDKNEIPSADLEKALCALGYTPSFEELTGLTERIDPKEKGTLHYNPFLQFVAEFMRSRYEVAHISSEEKLKYSFDVFDKDENGRITQKEFYHIVKYMTDTIDDDECIALIEALNDDDNDDKDYVYWEDFQNIYSIITNKKEMLRLPKLLQSILRKVSV